MADVFDFVFVKPDDVVIDPIEEVEMRESVKTLVSEADTCWKEVLRGVKANEALLDIVGKIVIGKVKESIVDVRHSARYRLSYLGVNYLFGLSILIFRRIHL